VSSALPSSMTMTTKLSYALASSVESVRPITLASLYAGTSTHTGGAKPAQAAAPRCRRPRRTNAPGSAIRPADRNVVAANVTASSVQPVQRIQTSTPLARMTDRSTDGGAGMRAAAGTPIRSAGVTNR
jgi:hypothetical protein